MHLRPLLAALVLTGLLSGCGPQKAPEPTTTEPAPSPAPAAPAAQSTIPAPEVTPAPLARQMFVVTEFRAVSQLGTHEFPAGTAVEVLEEDGEEFLVQHGEVAVKIHRSYLAESLPLAAASPTPDEISIDRPAPEPTPATAATPAESPHAPIAEAAPTPNPTPTGDEQRVNELTGSIRAVDEQIREAREAGAAPAAVQKLKQQRDNLSEELTTLGKP